MMRAAPIILMIILMSSCAAVPPGTGTVINPNCVWRCNVAPTTISENPSLETLTFDDGDVSNTETDTTTRTVNP